MRLDHLLSMEKVFSEKRKCSLSLFDILTYEWVWDHIDTVAVIF